MSPQTAEQLRRSLRTVVFQVRYRNLGVVNVSGIELGLKFVLNLSQTSAGTLSAHPVWSRLTVAHLTLLWSRILYLTAYHFRSPSISSS